MKRGDQLFCLLSVSMDVERWKYWTICVHIIQTLAISSYTVKIDLLSLLKDFISRNF